MISELLAFLIRLMTGVRADPVIEWPQGASILFANHTSHLDFLVIWAALSREMRRRTSPVAARDYWGKTRLRRWVTQRIFRAILLDRMGRPKDRSHPLAPVSEVLEGGRSIIIFPEGTRSLNGRLKKFKSGIHHLHRLHPECALIPMSLENLNRILPKGQRLPIPLIGRMEVHPVLNKVEEESRDEFLERLRLVVASGLKQY